MSEWSGPAHRLVPGDLPAAAKVLGVPQAALVAVLAVEARGSGFDGQGRPIILYEPHVMFRQLRAHRPQDLAEAEAVGVAYARWGTRPYPKGQSVQYARLTAACAIDPECALRSVSVGLAQILGENFAGAGYGSAVEMFEAFKVSEQAQLAGMLRLVRKWGLIPVMRRGDWFAFARKYNGPGAVQTYGTKLAAAYRQAAASGASTATTATALTAPSAPVKPAATGRVRIYGATADALNAASLARARDARERAETEALNARSLGRARSGYDGA